MARLDSVLDARGLLYFSERALSPALRAFCARKTHRRTQSEVSAFSNNKEEWRRVSQPLFDYEERVKKRDIKPVSGYLDSEIENVFLAEEEQTLPAHAYWRTPLHGLALQEASLVRTFGSSELEDDAYRMASALLDALEQKADVSDRELFPRYEDIRIPIGRAGSWPTFHPGSALDEGFRSYLGPLGLRLPLKESIAFARKDAGAVAKGVLGADPAMGKVFRLQEAKPSRFGSDRFVSLRPIDGPMAGVLDEPVAPISELERTFDTLSTRPVVLNLRQLLPEEMLARVDAYLRSPPPALGQAEQITPAASRVAYEETVVNEAPRTRSAYVVSKVVNGAMMGHGRVQIGLCKSHRSRRRLKDRCDGSPSAWRDSGTPAIGGRERGADFAVTPSNLDDAAATFISLHGQPGLGPSGAADGSGPLFWKGEDTPRWDLSVPVDISRGVFRAYADWLKRTNKFSDVIPPHEMESLEDLIRHVLEDPLITPAIDMPGAILCPHLGTIPSGAMVTTGLGSLCNLTKLALKFMAVRLRMNRQGRGGWDPTFEAIAKVLITLRGRGVVLATDDAAMALSEEEWAIWNELRLGGFGTSTDAMLMFLRRAFHLRTAAEVPDPSGRSGELAAARVVQHPMLGRLGMSIINYEAGRKADRPTAHRAGLAAKWDLLAQHPWRNEFSRMVQEMPGPNLYLAEALKKGMLQCALEEAQESIKAGDNDEWLTRMLDPEIGTSLSHMLTADWRDYLFEMYVSRQRMRLEDVAVHAHREGRTLEAMASARLDRQMRFG